MAASSASAGAAETIAATAAAEDEWDEAATIQLVVQVSQRGPGDFVRVILNPWDEEE